ncbi:WYL domain-containing protein [Microbacterium sp.]|uniref:helix-turn-helix transcriptional regulator n=1 Tax=Microbacterium sp. TaxID=51671 RepID=UPI00281160CE|nr:WYL domain-containing protein [Microbacterium sp.]
MSTPTDRALQLLSLLQGGGELSAATLARRLGVSERTVRRDARRLRDLGYDVRARPGPGTSYRLRASIKIPPLLLDEDEVGAVAVALEMLAAWSPVDAAASSAAAKLAQVLPPRLARRARAVALSTQVVRGDRPVIDVATLGVLADAVGNESRVRFAYTDSRGGVSPRVVEPFRHVLRGERWYLIAFDLDRDDWRLFRLDRIRDAEPLPGRAGERPFPRMPLEEWLATDFGRLSGPTRS